jgi:2-polyprenylphenol 6-hydroxylase
MPRPNTPPQNKPTVDAPIAVIGGGIMGALTALTAALQGHQIIWFGPAEQQRADAADHRNYALAPPTVDLLKRLGIWPLLIDISCTVRRMEVFAGQARVDLSATDAGAEFLSVMVLHAELLKVLEQAVQFQPRIRRIANSPSAIAFFQDHVQITHQDQKTRVQLLVGADGARSWVRAQAKILWGQRDYEQDAVVAAFETEHPHAGVAAQWFTSSGILALLPLPQPHRVSMVWSTAVRAQATENTQDLAQRISELSQHRFGELTLAGDVTSVPLRMLLTERQTALRTVLLGDAAHTVHPLAGYGLNLGVQDLLALEAIWQQSAQDVGATALIAQYEKSRQHRVKRVQWGLDLLQRLVSEDHAGMSKVREFGMRLVANIGPLRQFLIRQAISPQ